MCRLYRISTQKRAVKRKFHLVSYVASEHELYHALIITFSFLNGFMIIGHINLSLVSSIFDPQ